MVGMLLENDNGTDTDEMCRRYSVRQLDAASLGGRAPRAPCLEAQRLNVFAGGGAAVGQRRAEGHPVARELVMRAARKPGRGAPPDGHKRAARLRCAPLDMSRIAR